MYMCMLRSTRIMSSLILTLSSAFFMGRKMTFMKSSALKIIFRNGILRPNAFRKHFRTLFVNKPLLYYWSDAMTICPFLHVSYFWFDFRKSPTSGVQTRKRSVRRTPHGTGRGTGSRQTMSITPYLNEPYIVCRYFF